MFSTVRRLAYSSPEHFPPLSPAIIVITPADTVDVQARGSFPVGIEGYDTAVVTVAGGPQGPTGPRGPSGTGVPGGTKGQFYERSPTSTKIWNGPTRRMDLSNPLPRGMVDRTQPRPFGRICSRHGFCGYGVRW